MHLSVQEVLRAADRGSCLRLQYAREGKKDVNMKYLPLLAMKNINEEEK